MRGSPVPLSRIRQGECTTSFAGAASKSRKIHSRRTGIPDGGLTPKTMLATRLPVHTRIFLLRKTMVHHPNVKR